MDQRFEAWYFRQSPRWRNYAHQWSGGTVLLMATATLYTGSQAFDPYTTTITTFSTSGAQFLVTFVQAMSLVLAGAVCLGVIVRIVSSVVHRNPEGRTKKSNERDSRGDDEEKDEGATRVGIPVVLVDQ